MPAKVLKRGSGPSLRLTKSAQEEAAHNVDHKLRAPVRKGRIVVAPAAGVRGKYDLKTLLSGIPEGHRLEELNWGERSGKEVW